MSSDEDVPGPAMVEKPAETWADARAGPFIVVIFTLDRDGKVTGLDSSEED